MDKYNGCAIYWMVYRITGKFGEFSKSSVIRQTKTIEISTYNYNLLAEPIHSPNFFFAKCSKWVNSPNFIPAKLCRYMVFGSHFNLADFICVAKLKSHHLISAQHDLVKVFYVTRKAHQFWLFTYKESGWRLTKQ